MAVAVGPVAYSPTLLPLVIALEAPGTAGPGSISVALAHGTANAIPTAVRAPSSHRDTVFLIGIVYVVFAVLLP